MDKITLQDLKISPNCWQWMAKKTRSWEFAITNEGNKVLHSKNMFPFYVDRLINIESLESFIYQAIDGINEISYIMLDPGINEIKCKYTNKYELFICDLYDSKTTARVAALQWIWQQKQGQEIK